MLRIKKNGDEYSFSFFNAGTDKVYSYDTVDTETEQDSEQSRDYSAIGLQRAKRTIREYSLCNDWTHFVTFTFDLNKTKDNGNDNVKRLVIQTLNHYKTRYDNEFRYLLIPEYHADKKQLHFHGLVYCSDSSTLTNHYDPRKKCNYQRIAYFFDRFGAVRFDKIRKGSNACIQYSYKYMVKAKEDFIFSRYYLSSKGLSTGKVLAEYTDPDVICKIYQRMFMTGLVPYQTDYVTKYQFSLDNLVDFDLINDLIRYLKDDTLYSLHYLKGENATSREQHLFDRQLSIEDITTQ